MNSGEPKGVPSTMISKQARQAQAERLRQRGSGRQSSEGKLYRSLVSIFSSGGQLCSGSGG